MIRSKKGVIQYVIVYTALSVQAHGRKKRLDSDLMRRGRIIDATSAGTVIIESKVGNAYTNRRGEASEVKRLMFAEIMRFVKQVSCTVVLLRLYLVGHQRGPLHTRVSKVYLTNILGDV